MASRIHRPAYQEEEEGDLDIVTMVGEFAHYYGMDIPTIYEMPSQMFFVYYRNIRSLIASKMIYEIQQLNIANAQVYGDDKGQREVKKQVKELLRIAKGNK